jgi:hypothetical protein
MKQTILTKTKLKILYIFTAQNFQGIAIEKTPQKCLKTFIQSHDGNTHYKGYILTAMHIH